MLKRIILISSLILLFVAPGNSVDARVNSPSTTLQSPSTPAALVTNNDRAQDGLVGPVRRVRTETAKLTFKEGKPVEGPRVVLETATYDIKGSKIDNAYFLVAGGSLTGREVYKYDNRGNIIEMTLHNADGSVLSKESYAYELDAVGNWTKMTTSVAVIEGGKLTFEPTEITYRVIAYYLEETVAKMVQPAPSSNASSAAPAQAPPVSVAGKANAPSQAKPEANLFGSSPAAANKTAPPPVASSKDTPTTTTAPPEVAAIDRSKVYAASNAAVGQPAGAIGAPAVKVDGDAPVRPVVQAPVKPISGGILNGKAASLPKPVYPEIAKRARASGTVTVEVVIDVSGKVISAKAVSGPTMLHETAERAAMQARFSPTLLSGQPVKVAGIIHYSFNLVQ